MGRLPANGILRKRDAATPRSMAIIFKEQQ
jgi:hypothetical protein